MAALLVVLATALGADPTMARSNEPGQVDDSAGTGPAAEDPAVVVAQREVSEATRRRDSAATDLTEAEAAMQTRTEALDRARRRRETAAAELADARAVRGEAADAVEARRTDRATARERLRTARSVLTRARRDLARVAVAGYVDGEQTSLAAVEAILDVDASAMGRAALFDTVTEQVQGIVARAEDRRDDAREHLDRSNAALAEARAALDNANTALARADERLGRARSGLAEAGAARREATATLSEAVENHRAAVAAEAAASAELANAKAVRALRRARERREALAELAAAERAQQAAAASRKRSVALDEIGVEDVNIPPIAVSAYRSAAGTAPCDIPWWALAGIGRVESDHGRFGGSSLSPTGRATPEIIGVALDGDDGDARISDTDNGRLDGDTTYDRAVGPMQFIPSTWSRWAVDANDDGITDPHALGDAAATAARYLCASVGGDLNDASALRSAYFAYNRSGLYVERVAAWASAYAAADVPDRP